MSVDEGLFGPDPEPTDGAGDVGDVGDDGHELALVDELPPAGTDKRAPELQFPNVYVFVTEFLVHIYARRGAEREESSVRWCGRWWEHPEALTRLEALWQAFEVLRLEPGTGAATWWGDYADPTMTALLSPTGPFSGCGPEKHRPPVPLPSAEIPEALLHENDPVHPIPAR